MLFRSLVLMMSFALVSACGGDGDGGPGPTPGPDLPTAIVTTQERVDVAEFEAAVATDPALAAVAAGLTIEASGYLEDSDGVQVLWAEGALAGGLAAVVRHCRAGTDCAHAIVRRDAAGQVGWTGANGAAVSPRTVGRPVLLKNLVGFDLANRTVIEGALSTTRPSVQLSKADLPAVDFLRRRFVALNTFGPAFGARVVTFTDVARRLGGFHDVIEVDYARPEAAAAALRDLDAMDAVLWLGQGVRQEVQGGGRAWRTVGLTTNRGVFGDATMTRDALSGPLAGNVGGGPGLVLLLASNSHSDDSAGQPDTGSVWHALRGLGCVLVGVAGHADAGPLMAAAAAFLEVFLDGDGALSEALAAGNAKLTGTGARLVSNQADESVTFPASWDAIWASRPLSPSRARLTVPFTTTPYCAPVGQPKQPGLSTFTTAWADVTFDGAAFEGRRVLESSDLNVDTRVRGVLTGFTVGDRIHIEAIGDFDKNFREFHGFGEGVIESVTTEQDGRVILSFKGIAHTAEYRNEAGDECVLNNPRLATTTSGPGRLELTP